MDRLASRHSQQWIHRCYAEKDVAGEHVQLTDLLWQSLLDAHTIFEHATKHTQSSSTQPNIHNFQARNR